MSGARGMIGGLAGATLLACGAGRAPAQAPVQQTSVKTVEAAEDGARVVAVVNGDRITAAELEAVMRLGGPTPLQLPEAQRRQHQMEAPAVLVDDLLMHQFLDKNAPPVPQAEVDKKIAELETGLKKQGKSLQEFCRDMGQTEAQVRKNVGRMLQWTTYVGGRLTDAEVEKYYREYKDVFDRATVRASHIVLRLPADAPAAEAAQARAKLADLRAQIVAGKLDFAEAAKAHSQCPLSTGKGGDLGFFPRKWVFEESFSRAAFGLQVGQVSDVVQTEYGLHLVKVTDRKAGEPSDFAKIKDEVRDFCAEDMRQQMLAELRKGSKIEVRLP